MVNQTRRGFLKQTGAVAAFLAASRLGVVRADTSLGDNTYRLLVVGDSVIWGQGLEEKDKFYTLTKEWLEREAFGSLRKVEMKVKAHSGSTLKFHPDEAEKYRKAGRNEATAFKPEVNVGFPSIWKQIEVAAEEYKVDGIGGGPDLIMLMGGITDISSARVYDPNGDDDQLRREVRKYCFEDMYDVLEHTSQLHPNALISVVGYFPAISPNSSNSKLLNAWLEALDTNSFKKGLVNNPIVRPLFFNKLKKRAIMRSRIWVDESNKNIAAAVDKLNLKDGKIRAVFVRSPLTEDTAVEAPNTKLFRMGKNGEVADPMAPSRIKDCNDALPALKRETGIVYPIRLCEVAAIGHPDPSGARSYAESIKAAVGPVLKNR